MDFLLPMVWRNNLYPCIQENHMKFKDLTMKKWFLTLMSLILVKWFYKDILQIFGKMIKCWIQQIRHFGFAQDFQMHGLCSRSCPLGQWWFFHHKFFWGHFQAKHPWILLLMRLLSKPKGSYHFCQRLPSFQMGNCYFPILMSWPSKLHNKKIL